MKVNQSIDRGQDGAGGLKEGRWEDLQNWGIGYGGTQMAYVRIVDFCLRHQDGCFSLFQDREY